MFQVQITDNSGLFLDSLGEQVQRALGAVGELAVEYAREIVPVDTGALRESLTYRVDGETLTVGSDKEYAAVVETGTSRQRPQPYIRPAMEGHESEYKGAMGQELRGD